MKTLSWMCFCLSPFALFCSDSGNGLILCPAFIILGFIFKWAGDNKGKTQQSTIKLKPQEFWEWHYKDRMRSTLNQKDSVDDYLMSAKDKEARDWATTICRYHSTQAPPDAIQEQIARAYGVVTEKMIKEKAETQDRIQVGKYILMLELKEKYNSTQVGSGGIEARCFPEYEIKRDMDKIRAYNGSYISEYWSYKKYNKTLKEIWESLSDDEKNQAATWVEKYEIKLMEAVYAFVARKRNNTNVDIDF